MVAGSLDYMETRLNQALITGNGNHKPFKILLFALCEQRKLGKFSSQGLMFSFSIVYDSVHFAHLLCIFSYCASGIFFASTPRILAVTHDQLERGTSLSIDIYE